MIQDGYKPKVSFNILNMMKIEIFLILLVSAYSRSSLPPTTPLESHKESRGLWFTCNEGFYFTGWQCKKCPEKENCKTCDKSLFSKVYCTSCKPGRYLYNYECRTSCPDGYSENDADNTCTRCIQICKKCNVPTSNSQCTSCYSSMTLTPYGTCICTKENQYVDNNKCEDCDKACNQQAGQFSTQTLVLWSYVAVVCAECSLTLSC